MKDLFTSFSATKEKNPCCTVSAGYLKPLQALDIAKISTAPVGSKYLITSGTSMVRNQFEVKRSGTSFVETALRRRYIFQFGLIRIFELSRGTFCLLSAARSLSKPSAHPRTKSMYCSSPIPNSFLNGSNLSGIINFGSFRDFAKSSAIPISSCTFVLDNVESRQQSSILAAWSWRVSVISLRQRLPGSSHKISAKTV